MPVRKLTDDERKELRNARRFARENPAIMSMQGNATRERTLEIIERLSGKKRSADFDLETAKTLDYIEKHL